MGRSTVVAPPPHAARPRREAASGPLKLGRAAWLAALKRTVKEFQADGLTDWAAALTYYAVLSIFPALIVVVAVFGVIGPSATQPLLDNIHQLTPGPARDILTNAINGLQESQGAAGVLLVVGLAGALWSASGYIGAFIRASNVIWDVEEGRSMWQTMRLRLAITTVMLVLLSASAFAVVFTGPLADEAGSVLGVGADAVRLWDLVKWPVVVLMVATMLAILYYHSPNVRQPGFRWVTPGGLLAVVVWALASAGFALYVANFGSYNKTYGSLGGVVVFLIWLWISNLAILLGAEFDAELERQREIERGHPADREPFLPLREEPNKEETNSSNPEGKESV